MSRIQAVIHRVGWSRFAVLFLIIALPPACHDVGTVDRTADWQVRRAVIQFRAGEPLGLVLPDTFRAGVPTTFALKTLGDYCTRPGNTEVSTAGMVITLEPYDTTYPGDCISLACDCKHPVTITFPTSGTATLRVIGRRGLTSDTVTVDTVLAVH